MNKQELQATKELSLVDRAFMFWYVNRTSFNGIGGFAVTTNYIRRKTSKSISDFICAIENLDKIHERLQNVIVENKDALELIPQHDREDAFQYLDPPYHHSTRTSARYEVDMNDAKQKEFIDLVLSLQHCKVMISGYDCEEYDRFCQNGWQRIDLTVTCRDGNNKRKNKIECLWINYKHAED